MSDINVVSLIGGECSGKSTLAGALSRTLHGVLVVEQLRLFVDEHSRPPTQAEQAGIMAAQIQAERDAAGIAAETGRKWVIGDPAALMTAVYSVAYFGDVSLIGQALAHQSNDRLTVWCDIDLPWEADGGQRDGPGERQRVHEVIADVVSRHDIELLRVSGSVDERVAKVLAALGS